MDFEQIDVSYWRVVNVKRGGFTDDWHVIFHMIWFFNTTGDVANNGWFRKLENFPKNVYDGVSFNKIARLCCTNCNSTMTNIDQRFFSEYVSKNYISGSTTEVSPRGFCDIALYKILEKFLQDIFVISYLTKIPASNLQVATLLKNKCLTKTYRTNF